MKIEIKLFASLKKLLPPQADGSTATLEVEDGLTVAGLLGQLQGPKELAQLVLVNGVNIEGEYSRTLGEGDTVSVFPPVAGGIAYPHFPDLDNAPEKEVAPGIKPGSLGRQNHALPGHPRARISSPDAFASPRTGGACPRRRVRLHDRH